MRHHLTHSFSLPFLWRGILGGLLCLLCGIMRVAQTSYIPPYAENVVRPGKLLPQIHVRLPQQAQDASNMTHRAMMDHCIAKIQSIKGRYPRRWYIGETADPNFRLLNPVFGHARNYSDMFLLIAAVLSDVTRPIEKTLIELYQSRNDFLLINEDPNAEGSRSGSPFFLYVCFAEANAMGSLLRRARS